MGRYQLSSQLNGPLEILPGIAAVPAIAGMESALELPRSFMAPHADPWE